MYLQTRCFLIIWKRNHFNFWGNAKFSTSLFFKFRLKFIKGTVGLASSSIFYSIMKVFEIFPLAYSSQFSALNSNAIYSTYERNTINSYMSDLHLVFFNILRGASKLLLYVRISKLFEKNWEWFVTFIASM